MKQDWTYIDRVADGKTITVERVRIDDDNTAVEGWFELPPLARLEADDQVFVAVFVKCHGSIKQMEKHFGISYPTVKNRLNRIGEQLGFVQVRQDRSGGILSDLEAGKIDVNEAIAKLQKREES